MFDSPTSANKNATTPNDEWWQRYPMRNGLLTIPIAIISPATSVNFNFWQYQEEHRTEHNNAEPRMISENSLYLFLTFFHTTPLYNQRRLQIPNPAKSARQCFALAKDIKVIQQRSILSDATYSSHVAQSKLMIGEKEKI